MWEDAPLGRRFHLATLTVPWVMIWILDKRPLSSPSYHYQKGAQAAERVLALTDVRVLVNTLRDISGVIVVPVTS